MRDGSGMRPLRALGLAQRLEPAQLTLRGDTGDLAEWPPEFVDAGVELLPERVRLAPTLALVGLATLKLR